MNSDRESVNSSAAQPSHSAADASAVEPSGGELSDLPTGGSLPVHLCHGEVLFDIEMASAGGADSADGVAAGTHSANEPGEEASDRIAVITLDRDHKRNALNAEVCAAVAEGIRLAEQHGARAVLIRGRGKAFCAGADLAGGVYTDDFHTNLQGMLSSILNSALPVIADVQGPAVGAGTQLAMACDLRVVGERGWFKIPVALLGIAVDNWTINRCVQLMGGGLARTFLLSASTIGQSEAVDHGFASLAGDSTAAFDFACELAAHAPMTMHHLKMVLNEPIPAVSPTEEQSHLQRACWDSEDAAEARRARAEKRKPRFEGK